MADTWSTDIYCEVSKEVSGTCFILKRIFNHIYIYIVWILNILFCCDLRVLRELCVLLYKQLYSTCSFIIKNSLTLNTIDDIIFCSLVLRNVSYRHCNKQHSPSRNPIRTFKLVFFLRFSNCIDIAFTKRRANSYWSSQATSPSLFYTELNNNFFPWNMSTSSFDQQLLLRVPPCILIR